MSCPRDTPEFGFVVSLAVLLAIFADDTAAYFGGRALGRHKLAPAISPGKTWEGFVFGTLAAILVVFVTLYEDRDEFLTIGESLLLGVVAALAAPLGDLFESMLKRDLGVKDSGRLLAGHGGVLDRIDAIPSRPRTSQCMPPNAGTQRAAPYTGRVKRVALLGATVDRPPGTRDRRRASGARARRCRFRHAIRGGLAPLTQVGGDLTELLERAEPDVVLNAVVGFAGLPATLWSLEAGVDLALANKESLVAAGELALAAQERGGGLLLPVDSEHSASFQCLEREEPRACTRSCSQPRAARFAANPPTTWPT